MAFTVHQYNLDTYTVASYCLLVCIAHSVNIFYGSKIYLTLHRSVSDVTLQLETTAMKASEPL